MYAYRFLLRGGWRRRTLRQQLSLVECPNTNEDLVVLLHTRREAEALFAAAGFSRVHSRVCHIVPGDIVGLDVLLPEPERPRAWLDWVGR